MTSSNTPSPSRCWRPWEASAGQGKADNCPRLYRRGDRGSSGRATDRARSGRVGLGCRLHRHGVRADNRRLDKEARWRTAIGRSVTSSALRGQRFSKDRPETEQFRLGNMASVREHGSSLKNIIAPACITQRFVRARKADIVTSLEMLKSRPVLSLKLLGRKVSRFF